MKQRINLKANDGNVTVAVTASINVSYPLTMDEQRAIKKRLQRNLADAMRGLPYTDFGPENVSVT